MGLHIRFTNGRPKTMSVL